MDYYFIYHYSLLNVNANVAKILDKKKRGIIDTVSLGQGGTIHALRCKAESTIDNHNNLFQEGIFSGNRPLVVRQNFYSLLNSFNFFYLFLFGATLSYLKSEEQKHPKASRMLKTSTCSQLNATLYSFKDVFTVMVYSNSDELSISTSG